MKIASFYDRSSVNRNDGAPLYMTHLLKEMGHEVVHLQPKEDYIEHGPFDLHLWIDWGEDALKDLLGYVPIQCPKPSVYWTSDTHLGYTYRLQKAKEFDKVFCMQKRAVEDFRRDGVSAEWLPHAAEPKCYQRFEMIPHYDICFVGHLCNGKRIDFLDRMFKEFPNFWYGQRLFEDAARIFCDSRIVLNTAAVDDINMRVFETLATGSFLLTEAIPTLSELFEDGEHLVTYKNINDAIDKAKYYLHDDEERARIAKAGQDLVLAKHTYKHRAEVLLNASG